MDWPRLTADLTSLVLAHFDAKGDLAWSNAGFQRLHAGAGDNAWRRFTAPSLHAWLGQVSAESTCVHTGLMTVSTPDDRTTTLRGSVHIGPQGLWVIAGYDIDEAERVSAAMLDLNQQLLDLQRALSKANRLLKKREIEIEGLSRTDPLTGVFNRRGLDAALVAEVSRQTRYDVPLSIVMLDVDHFKRVNDQHGHGVGDQVLRAIGQLLGQLARPTDHAGRLGGEEFVVVLPMTPLDDALILAERLRQAVQDLALPETPRVTISLGVTEWQPGENQEAVFARADQALYRAKRDGRNRVAVANLNDS